MTFLCVLFIVVAIGGFYCMKSAKTKEGKRTSLIVSIISIIAAFIFLLIPMIENATQEESDWDKLSEEEQEWYHRNYGDGQYEEYQDAIDDYQKKQS